MIKKVSNQISLQTFCSCNSRSTNHFLIFSDYFLIDRQKNKCKVMNVKPSWIDTPRVKGFNTEKMCPQKLSSFIYDLTKTDLYIKEVKIEV